MIAWLPISVEDRRPRAHKELTGEDDIMKTFSIRVGFAVTLMGFGAAIATAQLTKAPDSVDGRWNASLINNGTVIPFRLDISGSGQTVKGTFYDGFEPYDGTTSGTFQNGKLVLNVEHYLTTITATLDNGQLTGNVVTQSRAGNTQYGFQASRYVAATAARVDVPSIAGSWEIPLDSPSSKGEKAFRFVVQQNGPDVAASILRVDGDTGAYSGTYKDGKWVLSHYDGSRPGVIEVSPAKEGTLEILQFTGPPTKAATQDGATPATYQAVSSNPSTEPYREDPANSRYATKLVAYRPDVARARGLPEPENYETHTTVRDPNEKFVFNFPDVNGKLVSNDDPRFKGKVVLAIVTGTWCPNCHDEAKYLVQLDKKYHGRGLAIVALDFEEPEQQGSLEREHAFVKQYGVKYTYLIAGAPADLGEKVPQLVNLNTWPATVFVGRDGRVKGIHSGFASPASGEFNRQLQEEFTAKIEQLLAEPAAQDLATPATPPKPGQ
jgi:thiol-disulfide isomerase/thioredoxin